MNKVLFLTEKQFKRRFPNAKKGRIPDCSPRYAWRNPAQFQIKYPQWSVCHGFSQTSMDGFAAWAELGDVVLDLSNMPENIYFKVTIGRMSAKDYTDFVSQHGIPKKTFYRSRGISGVRRYSKAEMRSNMDEYQSYGPYKDAA